MQKKRAKGIATFKTSRNMRRGAGLIRQWFLIYRKNKADLDWGLTTPHSIGRWLRIVRIRLQKHDKEHPCEHAHHRHELLRWIEDVGDEGMARLVYEWWHLRGPSDAVRAARSAQRNLERLEKKHPLFAAMGALDEITVVPTAESTLKSWQLNAEKVRQINIKSVHPSNYARKADPDDLYHDDRMGLNAIRVWGRVSRISGDAVDRPHRILAREVWIANARDEQHLKATMGQIFYSVHAHGIAGNTFCKPALDALRSIAVEVTGNSLWLESYIDSGRKRYGEREVEKKEKEQRLLQQFRPQANQLVIPLEAT